MAVSFTAGGPSPWAAGTRSILTDPDIETKVTGVTLAAYTGGALDADGYYTSPHSMTLSLIPGRAYTVYALVNMGDMRNALPALESGLEASLNALRDKQYGRAEQILSDLLNTYVEDTNGI